MYTMSFLRKSVDDGKSGARQVRWLEFQFECPFSHCLCLQTTERKMSVEIISSTLLSTPSAVKTPDRLTQIALESTVGAASLLRDPGACS